MAFTYDLNSEIGLIRLELGDITAGAGVRPDGSNINDDELQVWLKREGSIMRAVAAACESLARMWANMVDLSVGPRSESYSQAAKSWLELAKQLRKQYGDTPGLDQTDSGAFSVGFIRERL